MNSTAAAAITNSRGVEVVLAVGRKQGQGTEPGNDILMGPCTGETLQQLLQDQASRYHTLHAGEGFTQRLDLRRRRVPVASQRQRPDTGIDQKGHRRERSLL